MIFSENKNEYCVEATQLLSPQELNLGLWLVIAGVDTIPPHIALISEGKYFSVSAKKVEVDVPLGNFLKAIARRSVPTLYIRIQLAPLQARPIAIEIRGTFEKYPTLGNGEHSCLWPVRDFFSETFDEKYSNASLVFELLALAQEDNLLSECKALFADIPADGKIILPKYTSEQIREKINSILKVNE